MSRAPALAPAVGASRAMPPPPSLLGARCWPRACVDSAARGARHQAIGAVSYQVAPARFAQRFARERPMLRVPVEHEGLHLALLAQRAHRLHRLEREGI